MTSGTNGNLGADLLSISSKRNKPHATKRREGRGRSRGLATLSQSSRSTIKPIETSDWYKKFGPFDSASERPAKSLAPIDWAGIDVTSEMHQPVEPFDRSSHTAHAVAARERLGTVAQITNGEAVCTADGEAEAEIEVSERRYVSASAAEASDTTFILRNSSYDLLALESLEDEEDAYTCVTPLAEVHEIADRSTAHRRGGITFLVGLAATAVVLTLAITTLDLNPKNILEMRELLEHLSASKQTFG